MKILNCLNCNSITSSCKLRRNIIYYCNNCILQFELFDSFIKIRNYQTQKIIYFGALQKAKSFFKLKAFI